MSAAIGAPWHARSRSRSGRLNPTTADAPGARVVAERRWLYDPGAGGKQQARHAESRRGLSRCRQLGAVLAEARGGEEAPGVGKDGCVVYQRRVEVDQGQIADAGSRRDASRIGAGGIFVGSERSGRRRPGFVEEMPYATRELDGLLVVGGVGDHRDRVADANSGGRRPMPMLCRGRHLEIADALASWLEFAYLRQLLNRER